ncbi:MAG: hypothetical protein DDT42_01566 [candidate division WS2 bacterium]|uniref:Uncharacterized protein n=1 Tax=Psychracetigena formicireducens TaxID=2986056 RepID=A0A9E2F512_PSYF1|nr:hypothetical protein [Candidatus Psychracetigena formicireducens]
MEPVYFSLELESVLIKKIKTIKLVEFKKQKKR